MRHKILNCLQYFLNNVFLSGRIQGDEKFVNINLKGTKQNNMPRFSKKRTSPSDPGISKHEVCFLSSIDKFANLILKIGETSRLSNKMLNDNLTSKVQKKSTLIIDSASPYRKFCLKNNLNHITISSGNYANRTGDNLVEINGIHSQLEIWLTKFQEVLIRHLQQY